MCLEFQVVVSLVDGPFCSFVLVHCFALSDQVDSCLSWKSTVERIFMEGTYDFARTTHPGSEGRSLSALSPMLSVKFLCILTIRKIWRLNTLGVSDYC